MDIVSPAERMASAEIFIIFWVLGEGFLETRLSIFRYSLARDCLVDDSMLRQSYRAPDGEPLCSMVFVFSICYGLIHAFALC